MSGEETPSEDKGNALEKFYDDYWKSSESAPVREQVFRDWWEPGYDRVRGWLTETDGKRVLIIGCGSGVDLRFANDAGATAVGVDLSTSALEQARAHGSVVRTPAEKLPFAAGAFDAVWIANVLMFTQRRAALEEARRVCAPNGSVLLLEPMRRPIIVRWLRRFEPFSRFATYWEPADLEAFRAPGERAEMHTFFLFSPLWVGLWRRRAPPSWARRVLDLLRGVDRGLLGAMPFLKRWAFLAAVRYRPAGEDLHCPVCERVLDAGRLWHEITPEHRFALCDCGAASLAPLPVEVLADHYGDDYWKGEYGYVDYEADRETHQRNFGDALEWILAHRRDGTVGKEPKPARWLEVGCGPGYFSELARKRGFDVRALERSPWAVQKARELLGDDAVREGDVSLLRSTGETYDVIVLHDVLEHLAEPRAALQGLREHLAPGGVLYVDYWDRSSLVARALGRRWHAIDPPDHLIHYESGSLSALATAAGLRPLAERSRGRRLALRAALSKALPRALVDLVPKAIADRPVLVQLGDLRQCLLMRDEE